jgi:dihydroorotase
VAALPEGSAFEPLMTLYLTDNLPPDEIRRAKDAGVVALKLYPAGATTNSDAGVTDLRKTYPTLEAMQREGLILLVTARSPIRRSTCSTARPCSSSAC